MSGNEREMLLDAFDSNWIAPLGPHVNALETEFAEAVRMPHAVALASGTSALHLALLLLGVKPGDEVITSSFTFVATANSITYVNAKPVFIDSDATTWNMCPNLLADELAECAQRGKLPAAVMTVDVNGQCADYDAIQEVCGRYEVPIIEDAAEALGARYKDRSAGSFGTLAAFSFNGNKIITTSGGGMLVTDNEEWAQKARFLATQARDPAVHYEHSHVGYNYRLSNLLAAVGRAQLSQLSDKVTKRRANFDFYQRELGELPGISFMPEPDGFYSTRWLTAMLVDPKKFGADWNDIREALEAENIESRPLWKPMHMQPIFQDCRMRGGTVSEKLFEQGLCLPSGSGLTNEERVRVAAIVKQVFSF
jgi:dTDP-4-amino-4,6-dideoxygalactose transaminase